MVRVETLDVSLMPGVHFKHFTARDITSRWDAVQAYKRAADKNARTISEYRPGTHAFPCQGSASRCGQ